jgi:hypothetical protein
MTKKYKLLKDDTIKSVDDRTLYRIQALISIAAIGVAKGDLGGYVEREMNLSQVSGDAWVFGNARVSGAARVSDNAQVSGNASVSGNAWVSGNAQVFGDAWVFGNARVSGAAQVSGNASVSGTAWVSGNAQVSGNASVSGDAWVFGNARVYKSYPFIGRLDGCTFILVPTKDGHPIVIADCQYRTIESYRQHVADAYPDTPKSRETLAILDYFEARLADDPSLGVAPAEEETERAEAQ